MGVKGKICVVVLLFIGVVVVSASVSHGLSDRDPEVGVCKLKCEEIRGGEKDEKMRCKQRCEWYDKEKQRREREGGPGGDRGGRGGGGEYDIVFAEEEQEVKKMIEQCHQSCQGSQGEQQRPQCFESCMQRRSREHGRSHQGRDMSRAERTRRGDKQRRSNNPYVFEDHHFTARVESEHGNVRVLQKFTDRADLFQGIEKYRVVFLEAEPQTFIIPNHWDADALVFVANGRGTITLIEGDTRRSHNIKRGDLFRVPAGITAYLINSENNERLVLAKILHSVSVPGELQIFSVGGGNAESSYFNAFSTEVLEAAFDVDRDSIERMIGGQQKLEQGIFKKATEEQIRALSGKDEGRKWPFGERKEQGTHSVFKKDPSVANDNGVLYEIDSNDFPDLRDINVAFSFFNITQGSMAGPFYNTKATLVLMVPNGEGRFEMACPHLSEQQTRGRSIEINPRYEKVSSELRRGTVVVVPAGHPVAIEASGEQNLEVIGFGLKSDENEWFPLAGRDNVVSQWEDEALELTFGFPAREVQKVIQKQNQKLFFKGPSRSGRAFA